MRCAGVEARARALSMRSPGSIVASSRDSFVPCATTRPAGSDPSGRTSAARGPHATARASRPAAERRGPSLTAERSSLHRAICRICADRTMGARGAATAALLLLGLLRTAAGAPIATGAAPPGGDAISGGCALELGAALAALPQRCAEATIDAENAESDERRWKAAAAACLAPGPAVSACTPACADAVAPLRGAMELLRGLLSMVTDPETARGEAATKAGELSLSRELARPRRLQSVGDPCAGGATLSGRTAGSVDFTGGYADNALCSWTITCPSRAQVVALEFT